MMLTAVGKRVVTGALVRYWRWKDPVELPRKAFSADPADNIQQTMNLIMPLKDPSAVGRAQLLIMLATEAEAVVAGLHNTGIVHFARFTIVGDNLVMFSVFDGDFANYIRDFIYNIGTFFDGLMSHVKDPAPVPVEDHPDDFVAWVGRHDAFQLPENVAAISDDLDKLPRRLALTLGMPANMQIFVYRGYAAHTVAQVRAALRIGW